MLIVTPLMLSRTLALVVWDVDRWLTVLRPGYVAPPFVKTATPPIDLSLWRACGVGILVVCVVYGSVYRPKGMDLGNPAFYVLPLIALFPVVTLIVEESRRAHRQEPRRPASGHSLPTSR